MRSGITRQALRRHRATLLGPVATQLVAATVIATMVNARAAIRAVVPAGRPGDPHVRDVLDACTVFLMDSIHLTVVVVGVTTSLAVAGRLGDLALVRSVGASPAQLRRSLALQSVVTAVPAALLGVGVAVPVTAAWLALLRDHGVVPAATRAGWTAAALGTALGAVTATSLIGAYVAGRRTARMKPAAALVEIATGRRPRAARVRTVAGALLVAAGVVLAVVLARFAPDQMVDAGVFVLLAQCLGAGLLAPALLRVGATIVWHLVPTGPVRVATDDLRAQAHRLGGALVPLTLGGAFAATKIGLHAGASAAGVADAAGDRWVDASGTAVFLAFAVVASVNCLVTSTLARHREWAAMQLAGAGRATVLRVVAVEAGVVALVATVASGVVALGTLLPIAEVTYGRWWPSFPVSAAVLGGLAVVALVAAAMVGPAVHATRTPPVRVVAAA